MLESQLDNPIILSARLVLPNKSVEVLLQAELIFSSARIIPQNVATGEV